MYTQNIRSTSFARIYPSLHLYVVSFSVLYRTIFLHMIFRMSFLFYFHFHFILFRQSQLVQQFKLCSCVHHRHLIRLVKFRSFSPPPSHTHTHEQKNSLEIKINSKFGLLNNVIRNKIYEENKE